MKINEAKDPDNIYKPVSLGFLAAFRFRYLNL